MKTVRTLLCVLFCLFAQAVQADTFPSKPIKIIVAFGPGSGGDILARLLAQYLQPELNTPIVVENKVGALGQIATSALARAPADGYTLGMGSSSTHSTATFLTKNVPYDPIKDFSAVGGLNNYTFVLLVPAGSTARTPHQLVQQLHAKDQVFYGFGNASGRVGAAHFNRLAKLKGTEVAYKSSPDAMTDLAAGRVEFMFSDWGSARPFVEGGRLRAIGVMADQRSPVLPDLPAVGEAYPGFDFSNWGGLMAPAGTPPAVIATLNAALIKVLETPEVKARMGALGLEVKPSSAQDLAQLIVDQQRAWGAAIHEAGIEPS
ncbi:Bug family tripartite tricarboxylate transporter substrate binding protein [Bordetella petrii]|uniref:Bug family tripartite tricarboxylate transporter substrate binding protein n=1 Tax=Bordetella petrii TaxID=94624 RepID=UPI001E5CF6FE|nr:tripartite tricarboxylate transporter substrate binding protein [Bordetella petrii]MCD0501770.1 tripartite tricarboxylate transporter substrate binding protein [Bordetella petrii]